jgi:hypothetical protein
VAEIGEKEEAEIGERGGRDRRERRRQRDMRQREREENHAKSVGYYLPPTLHSLIHQQTQLELLSLSIGSHT